MLTHFRPALSLLLVMSAITGAAYPALVTGIAQAVMPGPANGSMIQAGGKTAGSSLIGQPFSDPKHFWSRPSATSPYAYNAGASSGSNLGPTNKALTDAVTDRVKALRDADPGNPAVVPVDLVTASASGLDPHISPAAAEYQVRRIARERKLDPARVRELVASATEARQWGVLGEARVNVLALNLALDRAIP
ncbi:MAG TPA: potassium-transporting ATPase subunit KdpC [Burkholderiales bacterium]|jgi:K+-transporting ATPase ATPase C chain|nr:potassium-transporting ATPase subunit KdpC [Burkholderiales bacterium]